MLNSDQESDDTLSDLRVNSKITDPCLRQRKFQDSITYVQSVAWLLATAFHLSSKNSKQNIQQKTVKEMFNGFRKITGMHLNLLTKEV